MNRDLVFDIGMNNGDDSAYYLHLGYRVLGVDANPRLTAQCSLRFENEIRQGRMTIVNVGVLQESGEFTFYRNLTNDEWSSFDQEWGKKRGQWEEIKIPCVTTAQLIAEHGRPFYMKVDVEGADLQTLLSLTPENAPPYVSLELNKSDRLVEKLIDLGYSGFKFVDGETHRSAPPIFDHEIGWRLLRKTGRLIPFVRAAVCMLPERFRAKSEYEPPGKYSPDGYRFTEQQSGPFGEQAAGAWLNPEDALRWFGALKENYRKAGKEFWEDVHARHSSCMCSAPLSNVSIGQARFTGA